MKKLFAVLVAFAMVMGMNLTAFADDAKPLATNTAEATITNVEENADIKLYQIVDAFYNENGLVGYVRDNGLTEDDLVDIYNPTYTEIMEISKKDGLTEYTNLEDGEQTEIIWSYSNKTYTTSLEAGMYLVLVVGESNIIYNPMIISIGYDADKSGSMNTLQPGSVSAEDDWELANAVVAAKSSNTNIEKEIIAEEGKEADLYYEVGQTVNYKVTTTIPSYSEQYTEVTFKITDEIVNGLEYVTVDGIIIEPVVKVGGTVVEKGNTTYSVDTSVANHMIIDFDDSYILGLSGKTDVERAVEITYSAVVTNAAITSAGENKVTLNYTHDVEEDDDLDDTVYVYTFEFNILKVDENTAALPGAIFTLYRDANLEDVVGTCETDEDGIIKFEGLNADVIYYLTETSAPEGYSINENLYKVTFDDITLNGKEHSYNAIVSLASDTNNEAVMNIPNTPLSSLPSTGGIGTAVFTIGGCAIMIAAAYFFFVSRKKEA